MLQSLLRCYERFRLSTYRSMFALLRERDGSLSATEAFSVDVIYLLRGPTIKEFADCLGISQPNATYKVNNLSAKGYVHKATSEDDRRECRLHVSERFHSYYDTSDRFIQDAVKKLEAEYSAEELETFSNMLQALCDAVD